MLRTTHTTETRCAECGRILRSAQEWSQCRSNHALQRTASTPEGRLMLEMLKPAVLHGDQSNG